MDQHQLLVGVLHLSSPVSYQSKNSKNGICKRFTPLSTLTQNIPPNQNILVKTKKPMSPNDIYIVAKVNMATYEGTEFQYIGNVGDIDTELEVCKLVCTVNWKNNKLFANIDNIIDLDLYQNKRVDLTGTDIQIYSIDPIGCKDIDDALHIKKINDICYEVGVHIACVSSHIPIGSDLDLELANCRSESVYLKHKQINMLPEKLVVECSLTEKIPKRAVSAIIRYNGNAIESISFENTLIKVNQNLTYEQAHDMIENKTNDHLIMLNEFAKIINPQYELMELDTHKMVEIYMVLANKLVAEHISKNANKILVRKHNGSIINPNGLYSKTNTHAVDNNLLLYANMIYMSSAEYCLIDTSKDDPNDEKFAHVGLGADLYTHFTSPIRRYADIIVHRILIDNDYICDCDVGKINLNHKLYHQMEQRTNLLSVLNLFVQTYGESMEVDGIVVNIDENSIKVYINELNACVNVKLVSDKLYEVIQTEPSYDPYNRIKTIRIKDISINIFDKVKIMVAVTMMDQSKIKSTLVYPQIVL